MSETGSANTGHILEIMAEIAKRSVGGNRIFRGEPEHYEKVSSTLYRQYEKQIEAGHFDIGAVQTEILREAIKYTNETDSFEILAELQHHGGKTNLIDFTTDLLIALFFACNSSPHQDGRVIVQRVSRELVLRKARHPRNRVISQKSIFALPPKGFIEPDHVVSIPKALKQPILDYLRKCHGISTEAVYNDLHGFIANQRIHDRAYTEFYRGLGLHEEGHYDEAIHHYTESVRQRPNHSLPYNNRGNCYSSKGEFDRAIEDYTKAIELEPNDPMAYNNRANTYEKQGKSDQAIEDSSKAIELGLNHPLAYVTRAKAYGHEGAWDRAIEDYDKVIELEPNLAEAYNDRGAAYENKGELARAIEDYGKAIELDPNLATAYYNRGAAHGNKDELDRAIEDYGKVIELEPNLAKAYNNRGVAYEDKGEFDRAIEDYGKAIELDSDYAETYYNRGIVWLRREEWTSARLDLGDAKVRGVDIIAAFQGEYGSIADFEERCGVNVPEDIKAMLTPRDGASD